MKPVNRIQRAFLAASIAITGVLSAPSLSVAQDSPDFEPQFEPDSYESILTGWVVDISGGQFVIDDVVHQNYSSGENEQIRINGSVDGDIPAVVEISLLDDEDTPDETIELWISGMAEDMDELEIMATGLDDDVYWYYVEGAVEGQNIAFYIQVHEDANGNVDVLESVFTVDGYLVDVVAEAQGDISIDGDDFMDDVELDDLESLVDGGPFRDSSSDDESGQRGNDDSNGDDNDVGGDRGRDRDPSSRDDDDATEEAGS